MPNDDSQIVALRYDAWKAVFLENRGDLRRDPFERAQQNSNTYKDWFLDRVYALAPMNQLAAKFLMSMKEYPPSQTAGSFNLEKIRKQIEASLGGR